MRREKRNIYIPFSTKFPDQIIPGMFNVLGNMPYPLNTFTLQCRVSSERNILQNFFSRNCESENFAKLFSHFLFRENFAFFRETDWSEISRKRRKFSHFSRANEMRRQSEMVAKKIIFAKNAKFSRNDFSFSLETLLQCNLQYAPKS